MENYRGDDGKCHYREMWDEDDIALLCHISEQKAFKVLCLINKHYGFQGYAPIQKELFLEFYADVQAEKERIRLQNVANAATALYAQKSYHQGLFSNILTQVMTLLSNL